MPTKTTVGRAGDWVEVHLLYGGAPRRGQITEVLGRPGHEHYRVRWSEEEESIFYPADGVRIIPAQRREHSRSRT